MPPERRGPTRTAVACLVLMLMAALLSHVRDPSVPALVEKPAFAVFAIAYGFSHFPESAIFADAADSEVVTPFGWLFYALRDSEGAWTLIDAGFHDDYLRTTEWQLEEYEDPLRLLEIELGVLAEDVQTLVITHAHADHAGNIGRFPRATLLTHSHVVQALRDPENSIHGANETLERLAAHGRLQTFSGRWSPAIPIGKGGHQLRIEHIGGHAKGSCMVWLDGGGNDVAPPLGLFTGDEVYIGRSLSERRATGTSVNATRSSFVVDEIRKAEARGTRVLTFHEPNVLGAGARNIGTRRVM